MNTLDPSQQPPVKSDLSTGKGDLPKEVTEKSGEPQSGFLPNPNPEKLPKNVSTSSSPSSAQIQLLKSDSSSDSNSSTLNKEKFSDKKPPIAEKVQSNQTLIAKKTSQALAPHDTLPLSLINKLKTLSAKEIKEDKDLSELNKNLNEINGLLKIYLNSNLNDLFLIDKNVLKEINKIDGFLKVIVKNITSFNPSTENAVKEKEHLLVEFNKNLKLVEQAIKSEEHFIDPFEKQRDRNFYLAYSKFVKAKDEWRGSLFNERLNWQICVKNPLNHPEWPIFLRVMQKYIKDESKIKNMWECTIQGIDFQLNLNKIGKKSDPNPFFKELAILLSKEGLLSPSPGEPFALWSGGFEVSLYAQSQGLTTLEKTKAGQIFSALMLSSSWAPLGPLWNHLSQEFAKNSGEIVHVFFRTHDPLSVLDRQELKEISAAGYVKKIIFHPMINRGKAIDALDIEELQVKPGDNPALLLKNSLVKICQKASKKDKDATDVHKANVHAIRKMKLD